MYKPSGFIPGNLNIKNWEDIKPYFEMMISRDIQTKDDVQKLIQDYSDATSVFYERYAWSYINMSCHTDDKSYVEKYENFSTKIAPEMSKSSNEVEKKIASNAFFKELDPERFNQFRKALKRDLDLFREENVDLFAKISKCSSKVDQLTGGLMATIDGKELPMPQASVKLQSDDREERKNAWLAIWDSRATVRKDLDGLFNEMVNLRNQVALNAEYKNYRDYQHDSLHRFDYTTADAEKFQEAVEEFVVPLAREITRKHRDKLGIKDGDYRPWDLAGEPAGQTRLKPFDKGDELLNGAISIFDKLHPDFSKNLQEMNKNGLFDLDSRKGKAPGGYNYPLEVTGMPFIFMNAAGTQRDVTTMMHEGGHAMHTFLTNDEPLVYYRNTPAEMAETASMSMELMTTPHWDKYYNEADHLRARKEHLEGIISFFPWCAIVDAFQHWIYLNPEHTPEERDEYFAELSDRFGTGLVNWTGYEELKRFGWQRQSHIFGSPFYYIEYGIAQLGALQIYRNFLEDPKAGLDGYIKGLTLGSSKPLPEVWNAMNIKFDFSSENIRELMKFVQTELDKLNQ